MTRLNQTIAIEKGVKARSYATIGELFKAVQKPDLFNGFAKRYQALDEEGEKLPAESKHVQFKVADILKTVRRTQSEVMAVTAQKDWANCKAVADIRVDGQDLAKGVPVTYLLFLEKQLNDLRTFVAALPVLDSADAWVLDPNSGLSKSQPVQTHRTKKVQRPVVLYPATPEHPAQTAMLTEDVLSGHWETVKHSGAMPAPEKAALLERVEKLLIAVKVAREAANEVQVDDVPAVADALFTYLGVSA